MTKRCYVSLDGLRGVAVLIVLLAHAGFPFLASGGVGVDVFFVLSGFLITSILQYEIIKNGRIGYKKFYMRRILRLVPCLILTCILFCFIYCYFRQQLPIKPVFFALTYSMNWASALCNIDMSALRHCWSLAIEEQYYLIWPVAIYFISKTFKSALERGLFLFLLALLLALYRAVMVGTYSAGRIYVGLDTHMDGLVMGSALSYFVYLLSEEKGGVSHKISWLMSFLLVPCSVIGLLAVMRAITWESPWMGWIGYLIVNILVSFIVIDLVISKCSYLRKVLELAPVVYMGKISYGLYLLHLPVYFVFESLFIEHKSGVIITLKLFVSFILAACSYQYVETYFLNLKSKFE